MGFLDWRGWNRLDDLDRRTGLRRDWTEDSIRRTGRFLWVLTAVEFLAAVIGAVGGDWLWAVTFAAFAALGPVWNPRTIRTIRTRAKRG
ncbi:MAG: hypothetical protein QOG43_1455 [Actinomycetota bacterium]|jgi:hypothetical protein|nr:hypothetical protein [Actinomycetota bacterium]